MWLSCVSLEASFHSQSSISILRRGCNPIRLSLAVSHARPRYSPDLVSTLMVSPCSMNNGTCKDQEQTNVSWKLSAAKPTAFTIPCSQWISKTANIHHVLLYRLANAWKLNPCTTAALIWNPLLCYLTWGLNGLRYGRGIECGDWKGIKSILKRGPPGQQHRSASRPSCFQLQTCSLASPDPTLWSARSRSWEPLLWWLGHSTPPGSLHPLPSPILPMCRLVSYVILHMY